MKPEMAIGTRERVRPTDYVRDCRRCLQPVYMHDRLAFDAIEVLCVPCFIEWAEDHPDEPLHILLPPGVSPSSFLAFLKGDIPSPFLT